MLPLLGFEPGNRALFSFIGRKQAFQQGSAPILQ
jgi:hypothetical protein